MTRINEIDVQSLKHKLDTNEDFILLDVRENQELEICKIEQALHIPMGVIPTRLNEINFDDITTNIDPKLKYGSVNKPKQRRSLTE